MWNESNTSYETQQKREREGGKNWNLSHEINQPFLAKTQWTCGNAEEGEREVLDTHAESKAVTGKIDHTCTHHSNESLEKSISCRGAWMWCSMASQCNFQCSKD